MKLLEVIGKICLVTGIAILTLFAAVISAAARQTR